MELLIYFAINISPRLLFLPSLLTVPFNSVRINTYTERIQPGLLVIRATDGAQEHNTDISKAKELKTIPDLRIGYVPEGPAQVGIACTCSQVCEYKWSTTEIQTPDRPAACVIAQQYFSATFVSIALSFPHEKVRRLSKISLFNFVYCF